MTSLPRPSFRAGLALAGIVLVLLAAGCSSEPQPGPGLQAAAKRPRPVPMTGAESFFETRILAEVRVGTDGVPDAPASDAPRGGGGDGESRGRRGGGGHGQLGVAGGAGGFGGSIAGGVPFGGGGEGRGRRPEGGGGPHYGSGGRPVMIHLKFTNQGPDPVTLTIDDFHSALGNFAVRPEKLTLAPGQSLETDPMTSQLAGALAETEATLVLRVGPKAERKVFLLRAVQPPPGEAAEGQAPNPPKS